MWFKNYVMTIMCRGAGKCVGKDSYIFTDKGISKIQDLMNKTSILCDADFLVSDGSSLAPAQQIYYDGIKPVNILSTSYGYSINITDDHPLLIMGPDGDLEWKKGYDTQEGDYVCISRGDNIWGNRDTVKDLPYYLGLLIGNGCLTRDNVVCFTNEDDELLDTFIRLTASLFDYSAKIRKPANRCREVRIYSKPIRKKLFNLGLGYENSLEKKYPQFLFDKERMSTISFLQGLFDTNGTVSSNRLEVSYCTVSKELSKIVHLILLNLGIIARKRFKSNNKNGAYLIDITGDAAVLFSNTVGFRLSRKQLILEEQVARVKTNTNKDIIPNQKLRLSRIFKNSKETDTKELRQLLHKYANYYTLSYNSLGNILDQLKLHDQDVEYLSSLYKNNHVFDKIVSKHIGAEEVYDLCIPEENQHAFVANGFINHNTFLLGIFAALKALLYPGHRVGLLAPTFRQCVVGDTLVCTDKGMEYVVDIKDPPSLLLSSSGIKKCSAFFKNLSEKTIKITSRRGFSIEGALDHRILIIDSQGELVYKELSNIQDEDFIFLPKNSVPFGKKVDLKEYVYDPVFTGNTRDCFIPPVLDQDLSYFLGLLTGDGCLTQENYIHFTNTDPIILNIYEQLSSVYFNTFHKETLENNKYQISKGNKKFYTFLNCIGLAGKYAHEKTIPAPILCSSRENIEAYLCGLFDTDGGCYLYPNTSHPYKISISLTSEKLINEIQVIFLGMGIVGSRYVNNSQRNKPLHCLDISDKESIFSFQKNIGFRSETKNKILSDIVSFINKRDVERLHSDILPNIGKYLGRVCQEIRTHRKGFGYLNLWKYFDKHGNLRTGHGITRNYLKKILSYCEYTSVDNHDTVHLQKLLSLEGIFDGVKSREFGFDYTYDFTVEETHDYFSNGFISHNSKMIFDEVTKLWQGSPMLQASTERKPTQQSDNCYLRFKAVGGKPASMIQAIPLGDGCLADGMVILDDRLCLIQDLLDTDYSFGKEEYLQNVTVFGESKSFSPVEYVWSNGETDNLRITTHKGYSVEGTLNHPIRTVQGDEIQWKQLDQLNERDYVVIDRTPTWHNGTSDVTQEEAYVAGLLTGDGNLTNEYYIDFSTADEELYRVMDGFFSQRYGKRFSPTQEEMHYKLSSKSIRTDFISRLGITGVITAEKYFPLELLKAEKYKMSAFIRGLFDTDGDFSLGHKKGDGCVSFYNISHKLVKDLQNILLLFGIVSTISIRPSRNKNWKTSYHLMITGNDVEIFYKDIGFGLERKQKRLEDFVLSRTRRISTSDDIPQAVSIISQVTSDHTVKGLRKLCLNPQYIQVHYKNGIPRHRVRQFVEHCTRKGIHDSRLDLLVELVEKDYFYDRVTCIETSRSETFDVYVPNDHTFWSNGMISHNTKIRGSRFYTIVCDEFPHIPEDIFNLVIRPMAATSSSPMERVRRIEKKQELLTKGLITQDQIDAETASTNQIVITSSGYFTFNHMFKLYCAYKKQMLRGNEKYSVFRVPYWHLPEGFLDIDNVEAAKREMSNLEFRMEYEADFIPDTDAFYKASLLEVCSQTNFITQIVGTPGKSYCLGIDPARAEDSFAICVAEVDRPAKIVCAYEFQKVAFPKMTTIIEDLCDAFNVEHIYMDAGGGGLAIKDILAENSHQHPLGPILDPQDEMHKFKTGRHILIMCNFSTDFISDSNYHCLRLLEHRDLLFPSTSTENNPNLQADEAWSTIQDMKSQMQSIELSETPTGKNHFDVSKGGGHGKQKKDLYTAFMLAGACVYDTLWSESLPESILHQGGTVRSWEDGDSDAFSALDNLSNSNPELAQQIRDKIEMVDDPEAYRNRLIHGRSKRTLITSSAAVLKPVPKKKR